MGWPECLTEKVTSEQRLEGCREISRTDICGKRVLGRGSTADVFGEQRGVNGAEGGAEVQGNQEVGQENHCKNVDFYED